MTQKNYQALSIFEISAVVVVYLNCFVVVRLESTICAFLFVSLASVLHIHQISGLVRLLVVGIVTKFSNLTS